MKRKTRNAAKTRQEIIEKSAPIFNVNGYAGTSMQMLIDASGYQMGGIYRHFDTKMDLAKAVFQYSYETLIKSNLEVDEHLNPKEKLLTIIENYQKMVVKPRIKGGCPLLNTAVEVDDTHKEFSQLTKSFVKEIVKTLEDIFEEGKASALFQASIEPKKEALYLFAVFEGAIMLGKILNSASAIFSIFEKIISYLEENVF